MEVPLYVKQIRSMHFSAAGQAEAAAYSKQILLAADARMLRRSGEIKNRASYFFRICNDLCAEKNSEPDWDLAARIHNAQGTDGMMPLLLSDSKNPNISILEPVSPAVSDTKRPSRRLATPEELAQRQQEFLSIPVSERVVNLLPIGYADRVFANLRFIEIKE